MDTDTTLNSARKRSDAQRTTGQRLAPRLAPANETAALDAPTPWTPARAAELRTWTKDTLIGWIRHIEEDRERYATELALLKAACATAAATSEVTR
jgi:hypothetical protein